MIQPPRRRPPYLGNSRPILQVVQNFEIQRAAYRAMDIGIDMAGGIDMSHVRDALVYGLGVTMAQSRDILDRYRRCNIDVQKFWRESEGRHRKPYLYALLEREMSNLQDQP